MMETPFSGTETIVGHPGVAVIVCAVSTSFTAIDERVFQETCLIFICTRNNAMSKHFSRVVIRATVESSSTQHLDL
ncbi:hypothetical protein [Komagataeibacter xylinus]|uniref:hypothetical protein n=1 Tax=Komagataeibacter xylinus TaxID=28448 RepID=UPI0013EB597A|nr:hypothetical protein [Komagataeibacter xylinus]